MLNHLIFLPINSILIKDTPQCRMLDWIQLKIKIQKFIQIEKLFLFKLLKKNCKINIFIIYFS
jgi:hypothetical protein